MKYLIPCLIALVGYTFPGQAQKKSPEQISAMIQQFKQEARGPYRDIRWFCEDGTTVAPSERCQGELGVQRARYRSDVIDLAKTNHVFLGQILSKTPHADFWDAAHHQSRMKQYQVEQFLRAADNGWVNRKAQYYRGAFQAEDEAQWGREFLTWALSDQKRASQYFFLIRQAAKDIPHAAEDNTVMKVRALSKELADEYAAFMNLRVKIHGNPEYADLGKVKSFYKEHETRLSATSKKKMQDLIKQMEVMYAPIDLFQFKSLLERMPKESAAATSIRAFLEGYGKALSSRQQSKVIAQTALDLRVELTNGTSGKSRLAIIEASNKLESMLRLESANWQPETLEDLLHKIATLTQAATGFGYLELWEWEQLQMDMEIPNEGSLELVQLNYFSLAAKRAVEWSASMIRANYADVISLYSTFELLAYGFLDEKIRASIILEIGSESSVLGELYTREAGFANQVLQIPNQSTFRGLNPGYAKGVLVVSDQAAEQVEIDPTRIYIFDRPPADLKPVAGIATVSEGNLVSHVQLLARNLGIPNAVLSAQNLKSLKAFNGQEVFYAVSLKGTVHMKLAKDMSATEKELFQQKSRDESKIRVPLETMVLDRSEVLNLREVDASYSGKICGPKAANLGQLKQIYPEQVVEGLVIPFGVFKAHVEQPMPGYNGSYWGFLKETFDEAEKKQTSGMADAEIQVYVLGRLSQLREGIKTMKLLPQFKQQLEQGFKDVLGAPIGKVPVFLRSDTNMEDLKDFTGAGLNLTLFNVVDAEKIWQGIRDVWASPYTERSYSWRQKYLLDPEHIYPSILVIPSINADYSGVMITKGVSTGVASDVTVAFNRGVGGAVEGQASETWILRGKKNMLLSPAREPEFMSLPSTGGTDKQHTLFHDRLLSEVRLDKLRDMANSMKQTLPTFGIEGPYDVELGFKNDKIWLFQVRPFVENKRASASGYLQSITPRVKNASSVPLNTTL